MSDRYLTGPKAGQFKPDFDRSHRRPLSLKQLAALRALAGHGNTMWSLHRLGLVAWENGDPDTDTAGRWRRRVRGAALLLRGGRWAATVPPGKLVPLGGNPR